MNHAVTLPIPTDFFDRPASEVAPDLLGYRLSLGVTAGVIVETEAYAPDDAASHSFAGLTRRNRAMFGPAGHAYVYRSYGLHWCVNVVCRPGHAVLIRALQPVVGVEVMQQRRGLEAVRSLCSGPGKLTQALAIDGSHDGVQFETGGLGLLPADHAVPFVQGLRIGISRAVDLPWRWGVAGSPWLSRRF